ncbi:zinc-binding dehydrogenase [Saccharomonospora sp. NPDC006951]
MRALVIETGRGLRMTDLPRPGVKPHEALIAVRAVSLNRADADEIGGSYRARDRGIGNGVAGSDLAGEVVAIGEAVDQVAVGDRVMAMVEGAFAELAAVDQRLLLPVPRSMSYTSAAALPSALMTEYDALVLQGKLTPGQSVLVTAATSGVGLFGADLARWCGATPVFGTTTSTHKARILRDRGLRPIVTGTTGLGTAISEGTNGTGVDLTIDHTGGDLLDDLVAATRIGGTVIQVGRLAGSCPRIDLDQLAYRRISLVGTSFRTRDDHHRATIVRSLREHIAPALAAGELNAEVAAVLPFSAAQRALNALAHGGLVGKSVLLLD